MTDFEIILFESVNGKCQVRDFIMSQPDKMQAKLYRNLEILEEFGNHIDGKRSNT